MINNKPSRTNDRCDLLRGAIEHRAIWAALLIESAKKHGIDTKFAHEAIRECGVFHGNNKYTKTDDLTEFAPEFANQDVKDVFVMEIKESSAEHLHIDFHYCPLVAAWTKLGLPEEELPELCDIAMDGDRGIISTFDAFEFNLGRTIANGDNVCEIRIDKVKK